jgi:hypothetical protein
LAASPAGGGRGGGGGVSNLRTDDVRCANGLNWNAKEWAARVCGADISKLWLKLMQEE